MQPGLPCGLGEVGAANVGESGSFRCLNIHHFAVYEYSLSRRAAIPEYPPRELGSAVPLRIEADGASGLF